MDAPSQVKWEKEMQKSVDENSSEFPILAYFIIPGGLLILIGRMFCRQLESYKLTRKSIIALFVIGIVTVSIIAEDVINHGQNLFLIPAISLVFLFLAPCFFLEAGLL